MLFRSKSTYFGRNNHNGKLTNLESEEEYDNHVSAALWMAFYKIKNCDIYYCIINDNLVDSTIIKEDLSDVVSFSETEDKYCVLNSHDGNFKDSVFNPTVDFRAQFIGDNVILANKFRFELDMFGESRLHMMNRGLLNDSDLPDADIVVKCSAKTTINKNKIGRAHV